MRRFGASVMLRRPMVLVVLIWLAGLGAAAQFGKISVLFNELRGIYGAAGDVGLGFIVSITGVVGLVFGTTAGLLVAGFGARRTLVGALLLGAGVSLLEMSLPPYPLMLLARVLEGVSHLAIVVIGPVLIANTAPERLRPFAMTLWASFFGVTYAVLAVIAPGVVQFGGPAALFAGHALWMVLLAVLLWRALPADPPRRPVRLNGLLAQHLRIYASPYIAAPAMGFCCYTFLYVAMLTLLPPATPEAQRAIMGAGMPLFSIVISLTLGVWMLNHIPAVRLVQLGFLVAIPGFVLLALVWGQGWGMVIAGFWLSGALGVVQGASFASVPELNPGAEGRSESSGAIAQLGNLGTATGTPVLAAVLAAMGPVALVVLAVLFCGIGITVHSLQIRRRRAA